MCSVSSSWKKQLLCLKTYIMKVLTGSLTCTRQSWLCLNISGANTPFLASHLQPDRPPHSPKTFQTLQVQAPDPASWRASRAPCSTAGRRTRASAPTARRWSTWTRTTRLWSNAASRPVSCSRTRRSRLWPRPLASTSWVRAPTRSGGWPGGDPRSVQMETHCSDEVWFRSDQPNFSRKTDDLNSL